jgi:hypothetical protein
VPARRNALAFALVLGWSCGSCDLCLRTALLYFAEPDAIGVPRLAP